jgi:hypothetical protein
MIAAQVVIYVWSLIWVWSHRCRQRTISWIFWGFTPFCPLPAACCPLPHLDRDGADVDAARNSRGGERGGEWEWEWEGEEWMWRWLNQVRWCGLAHIFGLIGPIGLCAVVPIAVISLLQVHGKCLCCECNYCFEGRAGGDSGFAAPVNDADQNPYGSI